MAVALGDGEAVAALVEDDVRVAPYPDPLHFVDGSELDQLLQRSWLATGFLAVVIQPRRCQPAIQRSLNACTMYFESVCNRTAQGSRRF